MPRMAKEFALKPENRTDNFHQIVCLAEKLIESLAKRVPRAEDTSK
jgi:ADP-ribosylglycohydrolase